MTAKKDRFLSVINVISILGVAIGVAALIVVIGVMTGFDRDLRDKIIGTNAHIVIEKESGLSDFETIRAKVSAIKDVTGTTAYIHGNVFLESGQRAMSLLLRGVDPAREFQVTKVNDYLKGFQIQDLKADEAVIGSQLAMYFGIREGDTISLLSPSSGVAGSGWRYKLKVVGIFRSGMYDYDMNLILVHLNKAQEIFNLSPDVVTGIGVKLKTPEEAGEVKSAIYSQIDYSYLVRTWIETNSNFFAAIKLEKFAMFIILTLIVLVASFNIVSTLIMTVTSKIKDIGILKSIGVPNKSIQRIFTLQGLAIGIIGTFWGLVIGITLCTILKKYQFIQLPQDIYYIDRLPVLVELSDVMAIVGAAVVISYLATIYPATRAANFQPVEALRYE